MMLCAPTVSLEVVSVATPEPFKRPVPILIPPSRNVTDPLGDPESPVMVAVRVTPAPKTLGLLLESSAVAVAALLTVSERVLLEPPTKLASPPKTASKLWEPTVEKLTFRPPLPELFNGAVPRVTVPSAKITEPVGVGSPPKRGCTVAVSVTVWLGAAGFSDEARLRVLAPRLSSTETAFTPKSLTARSSAPALVKVPAISTTAPAPVGKLNCPGARKEPLPHPGRL